MQATERRDDPSPAVAIDRKGEYRIDCYVRGAVPGPTRERIAAVTARLQRLHASDVVADYRVRQWPPERHVAESSGTTAASRSELVDAFERWADDRGHSLEPAFRRRERPAWPLGREDGQTCERVRVPVVALAVYADEDRTAAEPTLDRDSESASEPDLTAAALRGVVPYTERARAGDGRTYSVGEWLSAVESAWREELVSEADAEPERRSVLGGPR